MRANIFQMQAWPPAKFGDLKRPMLIAASVSFLLAVPALRGQDSQGESSSTAPQSTPAAPHDSAKTKPGKKAKDTPIKSAPDQPAWDPLRAEKDLEDGQYYLKKGDLDAAIDRFEDAAAAKPGFAIPYRYLGEAHEKKGQKREAIKSYTRYLDLYPHAEDKAKVRKKIDKLWSEVGKKDKSAG